MELNERLERVAVIGAGGKMGSGISLLLAREMTLQKLRPENAGRNYRLTLMDVNPEALEGLQKYLAKQAARFAEKNGDLLRPYLPGGEDPQELADQFVTQMQTILHPVSSLAEVQQCRLIFEAILEKVDLKTAVYRQLTARNPEAYFLSNTSSIPIKTLAERAGLGGRLIGFHFYNPPAVQKLVELIVPENVEAELPALARELGQRLGKVIIPSHDVAGFIGNGHFIRDGLYGLRTAQNLQEEGMHFYEAVYAVNRVTQDFLLRPMGIFQLIDYVGLDIFQSILQIMDPHFPQEHLHSEWIDALVEKGVKGGQFSDGTQKDGFLKYAESQPVGVYDLPAGEYVSFSGGDWRARIDAHLGDLPAGHAPWKALVKDPARIEKLSAYFSRLRQMDTPGAKLAVAYLQRSKEIGQHLVTSGVAPAADDVNGVLMYGFYHLYGPINDYV